MVNIGLMSETIVLRMPSEFSLMLKFITTHIPIRD
jgi:hypothetical protein